MNNKLSNEDAYDNKSKLLLSNKTVLCNIMKECIPEYKDLSKEEIIKCIENGDNNTHIKGINTESYDIKGERINYDILFTSRLPNSEEKIGMYIDIEPQNEIYLDYDLLNRAEFYVARLIDRQKGETFKNSNYNGIRKVYSIWICLNPKVEQRDSINLYSFNEICIKGNYHTSIDYKKMNIIMLYVGREYDNNSKGILEMFNLMFGNNYYSGSERAKKLNKDYNIVINDKEASNMTNLSRGFIQQGIEQGIQQGLKQGMIINSIDSIHNLVNKLNISYAEAIDILGIDESIKKEVLDVLKKENKKVQ